MTDNIGDLAPTGLADDGRTNAELTEEFLAHADAAALVEEPLESTRWPAQELPAEDAKALADAIRGVQMRELATAG